MFHATKKVPISFKIVHSTFATSRNMVIENCLTFKFLKNLFSKNFSQINAKLVVLEAYLVVVILGPQVAQNCQKTGRNMQFAPRPVLRGCSRGCQGWLGGGCITVEAAAVMQVHHRVVRRGRVGVCKCPEVGTLIFIDCLFSKLLSFPSLFNILFFVPLLMVL